MKPGGKQQWLSLPSARIQALLIRLMMQLRLHSSLDIHSLAMLFAGTIPPRMLDSKIDTDLSIGPQV